MDASTFMDILEKSKNKLLESAAADIADWSKLRHDKECLELFLGHNVAVVFVEGMGEFLVSSNPVYLHYLNGQRVEKNKNKVVKMAMSPKFAKLLKSRNQAIVRTWDLIKNNKLEIPMESTWAIRRWVGVNKDNIPALAVATDEILQRGKTAKK